MSARLQKNFKAFALLALSIVLGTGTSEAIHNWLDHRSLNAAHGQSAEETTDSLIEQTVKLDNSSEE